MWTPLDEATTALSTVHAIAVVRRRTSAVTRRWSGAADRPGWRRITACASALLGLVDRETAGWEPRGELADGPAATVALNLLGAAVPVLLVDLAGDPARTAAAEALVVVLRRELGAIAYGEVR